MSNERLRIDAYGNFRTGSPVSYSGLDNLKPEFDQYKLVAQKLQEWEWYNRFIAMNPDLEGRWEQHKTYEILKDEQLQQR